MAAKPSIKNAGGAVDVLLAEPKLIYRGWPFSNNFVRRLFATPGARYPQLAAALPNCRVAFLDGEFEPLSDEEYLRRAAVAPIVGMGLTAPTMALNLEINIRRLKRRNPSVKIVLGGHHPTFYAEEWLQRGVDAVVRGEGEPTFPKLIDAWRGQTEFADVPGVSFCRNGVTQHNADAPLTANLDDLPWPDWSIVDWRLYDLALRPDGRSAALETSRGCPHRCAFCCAGEFWRRTQRFKTAGRVIAELERLAAWGVRQVLIADDNFGARLERDAAIFETILRRGLDFSFWSFLRADLALAHPEFLTLAARAGLRFVLVGYESLSDATLDLYDKNLATAYSVRDYVRAYRAMRQRGIFVYGVFVRHYLANSAEQSLSWRDTRRFADITAQNRYVPMRGTPGMAALVARGYRVKDTFYADRMLPSYEYEGKRQSSRFALTELLDLIHPVNFLKMLAGDYVSRRFFRNLYGGLIKDALHFRPLWAKILWLANRRRGSLDDRQKQIVRSVLDAFD